MEDIQNYESCLKKILLRAGERPDKNTILNLRGTKAIKLENMSNTDTDFYKEGRTWTDLCLASKDSLIKSVDVTTWSSIVRNAVEILKPQLNDILRNILGSLGGDEVRATFECCLSELCDEIDINLNSNCPKRLFKESEELDLIKSSVYLNNKNHMIKVFTDEDGIDWYLCAVYTGEIIVMIQALLDTIYALLEYTTEDREKAYHNLFVLTYINRDDLDRDDIGGVTDATQDKVNAIDNELERLQMSKDLIQLQMKVSTITKELLDVYAEINDIQEKYNLSTVEDILGNIGK